MTERAAWYARVSTARQEQDQTIGSQLAALERAAAQLGLDVPTAHRFVDAGVSGARLDRPALDALRDAAADGLLEVVLVASPDRLARNFVHQQILLEELDKRGVRVHFLERPLTERPEDKLLVQMQGVIAEYERAKILERTRRGRLHKVRAGQVLPFTQAPYGYAIERTLALPRGVVVIDPAEAATLRAMAQWVLDEGLSARQVAKRLNAQGVRPRRAASWRGSTVHSVLANPAVVGTATFGRRELCAPTRPRRAGAYRAHVKSSHRDRPREQWILVPIPAILDAATQHAIAARFRRNHWAGPRRVAHEYLLRTLVVCGVCGDRMSARRQRSACKRYEYFYYHCARRPPVDTGRAACCTARCVRAEALDEVVWTAVQTWLQDPAHLARELAAWRAVQRGAPQLERDLAQGDATCRRLRGQLERLIDAYQRGAIRVEELQARRARVEALLDAQRVRAESLEARRRDQLRVADLVANLEQFATTLRAGLDALDFAGRQHVVRLVIERIVVTGERLTIEHAVPVSGRFYPQRLEHRPPRARPQQSRFIQHLSLQQAMVEASAPRGAEYARGTKRRKVVASGSARGATIARYAA